MKTKTKWMMVTLMGWAMMNMTSCSSETKTDAPEKKDTLTEEKSLPPVDSTTRLRIVNNTDEPVTVYFTLGATEGCLQDVSQIPYITNVIAPMMGSFVLQPNDSTTDYAPTNMGLNGNLGFNTPPLNCPTPVFPDGVNIFEFIINNSFQAGSPQNTIDISCVAGVNCMLKVDLYGGSTWNAGTTEPVVKSFYNAGISGNSGLVGIYPYGCDVCTGQESPPVCSPNNMNDNDKQRQPICNVQRNAIKSGGGVIRVEYNGPYSTSLKKAKK